ncbi:hypothetical protein B0H17DRAFT_1158567 [Mycena rosella]|uniref:NADH:flavin oxidoreductase/NADH oxidase N-terminal domain-containing protein n=1 Tax=Mycena rosella TaxID=1033263 RepID=A0AAD7DS10_MYCRO|nr:hypothetical protein B0H17DRAFT_1158567 [Mycena rosella]
MSSAKLFQPTQVGDIELSHPDANHAPLPHVAEYYEQRASTSGSLLISEATFIAPRAAGYEHAPGIWSDAQISAGKRCVTDRVHAKGSYIYLQLWALGRAAEADALAQEDLPFVSASEVPIEGKPAPRPLTVEEIQEYVQLYATAASNAVHKAGFDGVEIHSANGYLLDQFLHDRSNIRTDAYGGSVENRTRFPLEVADAVVKAVGQKKTGLRISPWGTFNDMYFADPKPTYSHLVTQLRDRYPELAYLHVVEPRVDGVDTRRGLHAETAIAAAEEKRDLVAFARPYISNPDLPYRLLHGIALAAGNRALYYAPGSLDPRGFTDYPFASSVEAH